MGEDEQQPYVTKTGKVLSDAEIETLADEAERGYDVSHLKESVRRWECTKSFYLTAGRLSVEAELNLTRKSVRLVARGPEGQRGYSHHCFVQAEKVSGAIDASREILDGLLAPYGVEYLVYESSARVVRPGEGYLRR
jgi:hypothetical protein